MTEQTPAVDAPQTGNQSSQRPLLRRFAEPVRRHRKVILTIAAAAVATLLLMAGSVLAWRFYAEWRLGRIELKTDDGPVVAQVLAESSDTPIGDPFDLVTRAS